MSETPVFLDTGRPPVPDIVVPRGVTPFYMPGRPVRGRLLRLGPLADALLTRHDNDAAVTRLAGKALALTAALATALKFKGTFSIQAKGDGPVAPTRERYAAMHARTRTSLSDCWRVSTHRRTQICSGAATWPSPSTRVQRRSATRASSVSKALR
jgi:hypothetical protein